MNEGNPKPMTGGRWRHRQTEEKTIQLQRLRLERCSQKSGIIGSHKKLKEKRKDPPWSLQRKYGPADILISDFQPPAHKKQISAVLSQPSCGAFLWQPKETHAGSDGLVLISSFNYFKISELIPFSLENIKFSPLWWRWGWWMLLSRTLKAFGRDLKKIETHDT